MMQATENAIFEATNNSISGVMTSNCFDGQPYTYWNSYPIYVCTDKTAKAIQILKQLQADKLIECKSVPKFIELVEKIAGIL
jgi:hypothetical protein